MRHRVVVARNVFFLSVVLIESTSHTWKSLQKASFSIVSFVFSSLVLVSKTEDYKQALLDSGAELTITNDLSLFYSDTIRTLTVLSRFFFFT